MTTGDPGTAPGAGAGADDATPLEQTRDDTDAGWGEVVGPSPSQPPAPGLGRSGTGVPVGGTDPARDRWLLEQRPPHWGRD